MMSRTAFALLKSIGASETAFSLVGAEVEKAALTIMQKLLKAKNLTIAGLRDICTAVGADTFAAVIDNLADKDVTTLVKKYDKLWPELKSAPLPQYHASKHIGSDPRLGKAEGGRLVAQDMKAGFERHFRRRKMHVVRRHDGHEIHALAHGPPGFAADHLLERAVTAVRWEEQVRAAGLRARGVAAERAAHQVNLLIHGRRDAMDRADERAAPAADHAVPNFPAHNWDCVRGI